MEPIPGGSQELALKLMEPILEHISPAGVKTMSQEQSDRCLDGGSHLRDGRFRDKVSRPQLKQLWNSHHEILRLHALGYKNVDIATMVRCTPQTVSNTIASDVSQGVIQTLQQKRNDSTEDIVNRIQRILPKCMDILEETLKDEEVPLSIKLREANNLLDRGGHGKVVKTENKTLHAHLSRQDIEDMKERMSQVIQAP